MSTKDFKPLPAVIRETVSCKECGSIMVKTPSGYFACPYRHTGLIPAGQFQRDIEAKLPPERDKFCIHVTEGKRPGHKFTLSIVGVFRRILANQRKMRRQRSYLHRDQVPWVECPPEN